MKKIGSHVVPEYYLKQFAVKRSRKNWQLVVYEKGKTPRIGNTSSESVENGYFQTEDYELESSLAAFEDRANSIIRWINNPAYVFSSADLETLSLYVALLFVRSRTRRDFTKKLVLSLTSELNNVLQETASQRIVVERFRNALGKSISSEQVLASIARTAAKLQTPAEVKQLFLDNFENLTNKIGMALQGRTLQLWTAPRDMEFATSDTPVITLKQMGGRFYPGWGFGQPHVIVVCPLSFRTCAAFLPNDAVAQRREVPRQWVWSTNQVIAMCMSKYLYARTVSEDLRWYVDNLGSQIRYGENAFVNTAATQDLWRKYFAENG
jgi:hypothetical protein